jgi:molybdate transport system substrate-binding protein
MIETGMWMMIPKSQRRKISTIATVAVTLGTTWTCALADSEAASETVTVFAAASLRTVMDVTAKAVEAEGQRKPAVSLAASSALAKQIEQGAPADVFISADEDWMDYLAGRNLIDPKTRTIVATNRLVLIAPASSQLSIDLKPGIDLATNLGDGRLAVADVKAVPAGKYAKTALQSLNAWAGVENKLAQAENVRAALALVSSGEAPLGIVYRSDAKSDGSVRVVGIFPANSHPPITYPAAVVKASAHPEAGRSFIARLTSPEGRAAFEAQSFGLPK